MFLFFIFIMAAFIAAFYSIKKDKLGYLFLCGIFSFASTFFVSFNNVETKVGGVIDGNPVPLARITSVLAMVFSVIITIKKMRDRVA